MTFAALSALPAWLILIGACALAAGLFFIKLRPPRILIPSLSLWQRVLDQRSEITLWERIRRMVSLAITLLIALVLVLAVLRPSRISGAGAAARGRTLIVLDSSWSMLAKTRGRETRWDRAIAEARRVAASSDQVAIATTAEGLVQGLTDDSVLVESALGHLTPSAFPDTSWPVVPGVDSVHFITDGAVAHYLNASVVVHSVFEPVGNVAITAFDVRPTLGASRRGPDVQVGEAYLEVANFSPKPQNVHITMSRGSTKIADSSTPLAAGESYRQIVPLARQGDPALHAHIEGPDNALDMDDDGYAWIARARPLAVTVVGDHTEWMRRLLGGDPDIRATFIPPSSYQRGRDEVLIFDRWAPEQQPAQPALYFAPPPDTAWLEGGTDHPGEEERRPRWETSANHPVLRGVDPVTLRIDRARSCSSASLSAIARSTRGTPLVCVQESGDRRIVAVSFGPADSSLPSAPAFPVLIANTLEWLARPETRDLSLRPGLTTFAEPARITRDDGESVPLTRVTDVAYGVLTKPGLYRVETAGAHNTLVVNASDPQRSNVTHTTLGASTNAAPPRSPLERPWWLGCALAALVLAFAEWWTWQRRVTV